MKSKLLIVYCILLIGLSLIYCNFANANYDPNSVANNKFGIHILFPTELNEAVNLVNTSGGDWGYVTIPIQASDKSIVKWQKFMDDCAKLHLIPLVRIATDGDYFSKASWSKPTQYDVLDFANFLNSLDWPTKNRYVIIYNEPNRADEWGGTPDSADYARILNYATEIFKQKNPDFFVISAGLDNASNDTEGVSIEDFNYMRQMDQAVPGIFSKIDGLASHSYPNPGFSSPPSQSREGIDSFYYQALLAKQLSGKDLPVFITETGWTLNNISQDLQIKYYQIAFNNYWDEANVIAVTPFILEAGSGPFAQFSFINNGSKTTIYKNYQDFVKIKGNPLLSETLVAKQKTQNQTLPTADFKNSNSINSIYEKINKSTRIFFKWILRA